MFKVNDKDTRVTSITSFWHVYCWLKTNFEPFSSVSIVDFEHVLVYWDDLFLQKTTCSNLEINLLYAWAEYCV